MDTYTIDKSVDVFSPRLTEDCYINFYGGEPLLAFDRIQQAVRSFKNRLKNQNIIFSMSTNGSLLDDEKLEFFNQNKFSLLLSFDGFAQNIHRKKGSFNHIVTVLKKLLIYPDIDLEINSVFTPKTIGDFSKSVQFMANLGIPEISATLSQNSYWSPLALCHYKEELQSLKKFTFLFRLQHGYIPFLKFRRDQGRGIFSCYAARDRLAITPDGKLWGCHLFADFYTGKETTDEYSKYCLGDLVSFAESREKVFTEVSANYSKFRMDQFCTDHTLCANCEEMEECKVCPIDNRLQSSSFDRIPHWICEQNKITRQVRREFWEEYI